MTSLKIHLNNLKFNGKSILYKNVSRTQNFWIHLLTQICQYMGPTKPAVSRNLSAHLFIVATPIPNSLRRKPSRHSHNNKFPSKWRCYFKMSLLFIVLIEGVQKIQRNGQWPRNSFNNLLCFNFKHHTQEFATVFYLLRWILWQHFFYI